MDVNLFDFATPQNEFISSSQMLKSQEKQRRQRKTQTPGLQEKTDKKLQSASSRCKRKNAESRRGTAKDEAFNTRMDVPDVTTHVLEVHEDKSGGSCSRAAASGSVDEEQRSCHQKLGLLREKLLRLAPSSLQQNTSPVRRNAPPSAPPLGAEAATESENEGGKAPDTDVTQIHSQGDKKSKSEITEDADSHREEEEEEKEVLVPDSNAGSCKLLKKSQNSKYSPHCVED